MDKSKKEVEKKLTRSSEDRIIAGVCGGVADYMGTDSTLVRLIFVLLSIGVGSGLFLYILAWLLIPERDMGKKIKGGKASKNGQMIGLVLVLTGMTIILNRFMPFVINWQWVGPVAMVVIGAYILLK